MWLPPNKSRREVNVEEAKAHIRKALKSGWVPIADKVRAHHSPQYRLCGRCVAHCPNQAIKLKYNND